jgi:hypothetical protein
MVKFLHDCLNINFFLIKLFIIQWDFSCKYLHFSLIWEDVLVLLLWKFPLWSFCDFFLRNSDLKDIWCTRFLFFCFHLYAIWKYFFVWFYKVWTFVLCLTSFCELSTGNNFKLHIHFRGSYLVWFGLECFGHLRVWMW